MYHIHTYVCMYVCMYPGMYSIHTCSTHVPVHVMVSTFNQLLLIHVLCIIDRPVEFLISVQFDRLVLLCWTWTGRTGKMIPSRGSLVPLSTLDNSFLLLDQPCPNKRGSNNRFNTANTTTTTTTTGTRCLF